jgi:hypothetical protein
MNEYERTRVAHIHSYVFMFVHVCSCLFIFVHVRSYLSMSFMHMLGVDSNTNIYRTHRCGACGERGARTYQTELDAARTGVFAITLVMSSELTVE